jgi:DNA modification methylase
VKIINQDINEQWALYNGDCTEVIRGLPTASVGLTVTSPPFSHLYVYSPSDRDMGNSRDDAEFFHHFNFLISELLRVTKPGRRACIHVQQLTNTKVMHGEIGWRDFRADVVKAFRAASWVYDGEVVIDKDPQAQAIRTKSKALMFVQKERDSSWLRPAMADYILLFRHPGENTEPVKCDVSNEEWIQWARPIWYGIRESDTLNAQAAREEQDEKHICPLQLGTIERCVRLWSNPGDTVLDPFNGIGSTGYVSLQKGRRYTGIELKEAYYRQAAKNLRAAVAQPSLFPGLF